LQWLSESEDTDEKHKGKTVQTLGFNFNIISDQSRSHLFGDNRERDGILREMEAMLSLLTVIRKRRTVTVKAELLSKDHGRLGNIDIEK